VKLIGITLVNTIQASLNLLAISLDLNKDVTLDRELAVSAAANLASGLAGGITGTPWLLTSMAGRHPDVNRLSGLFMAFFVFILVIIPYPWSSYIPKFFFGAVLCYLGLIYLVQWLWDERKTMSTFEYILVVITMVTHIIFGLNVGMPISIVLACVFFVFQYSRTNHVTIYRQKEVNSQVRRSFLQKKILERSGLEQILVVQLKGYLFFGQITKLMNAVQKQLEEKNTHKKKNRCYPDSSWIIPSFYFQYYILNPSRSILHKILAVLDAEDNTETSHGKVKYVIVDFKQVTSMDSTTCAFFRKFIQTLNQKSITILFTDTNRDVRRTMKSNNLVDVPNAPVQCFNQLELAVEWCENQIILEWNKPGIAEELEDEKIREEENSQSLISVVRQFLPSNISNAKTIKSQLNSYFVKHQLQKGEAVFPIGSPSKSFYFVKSGMLSCYVPSENNSEERRRLYKVTRGN
jgi:SulP family sulfate permease